MASQDLFTTTPSHHNAGIYRQGFSCFGRTNSSGAVRLTTLGIKFRLHETCFKKGRVDLGGVIAVAHRYSKDQNSASRKRNLQPIKSGVKNHMPVIAWMSQDDRRMNPCYRSRNAQLDKTPLASRLARKFQHNGCPAI